MLLCHVQGWRWARGGMQLRASPRCLQCAEVWEHNVKVLEDALLGGACGFG